MSNETILINIVAAVFVAVSLMFLPAFVELLNPKDAGPRLMTSAIKILNQVNLDENYQLDNARMKKLAVALEFLPNLEQLI